MNDFKFVVLNEEAGLTTFNEEDQASMLEMLQTLIKTESEAFDFPHMKHLSKDNKFPDSFVDLYNPNWWNTGVLIAALQNNGKLVSWLRITFDWYERPDIVTLTCVCTPTEEQGHGYATELLKRVKEYCKSIGVVEIVLSMNANYEPAKALYKKAGFSNVNITASVAL